MVLEVGLVSLITYIYFIRLKIKIKIKIWKGFGGGFRRQPNLRGFRNKNEIEFNNRRRRVTTEDYEETRKWKLQVQKSY